MRALSFEFENHNGLQLIVSANPVIEFHQLNQFELNMIRQNQLQNFLFCEVEVIDNEYKFHYNVYEYKKLHHYMQVRCTNQLDLYQFTVQLLEAIRSSYTNMLTPDGCLIHMDTLFYDEQTNQILLTYLPVQHKDKMHYSLLQWFLDWTNHIEVSDYSHLHRMFTYFIEQDFSLERIQDAILQYLYTKHAGISADELQKTSHSAGSNQSKVSTSSVLNSTSSSQLTSSPQLTSSSLSNNHITQGSPSSHRIDHAIHFEKDSIIDDDDNSLIVLDEQKPNKLRISLYLLLMLCIPLALWLKLYLPHPSTTNLLLSVGITLLILSAQIFIYTKMTHQAQLKDVLEDESFFAEDTGAHHPPYDFTKRSTNLFEQLNNATNIHTAEKSSHVSSLAEKEAEKGHQKGHEKVNEKGNEIEKIIGHRQLDTVKLEAENLTVQLGQAGQANAYIVRHHHNQEQRYEIGKGECIIGRSIEGVHINDPYAGVSRLHIQFEYKNGLVIAKDLGSRNGSYLNQSILTPYKNYVVNEQDSIQLVDKEGPIYKIKWT